MFNFTLYNMPKTLEDEVKNARLEFLRGIGFDESITDGFGLPTTLTDVETMRSSFDFFSDLGSDIEKTYNDYPQLLAHHKESDLDPKLQFLVDEIGISRRKVARLPELFTYSLDSMCDTYQHYADEFDGNEEQAKALLRNATTIFGNDTGLIDDKIKAYKKAGIDFHRNYSLLEIRPEKAIDTKNYLTELRIQEPETGKWYYMLLAVSRKTLEPKVEYCGREGIDWKNHPEVLVLGMGTDKKLGALPRRVNMIKNSYTGTEIPSMLDYKSNPSILILPDANLRSRIERHR